MKSPKSNNPWEMLERWYKFVAKIPFAFAMLLMMALMFLTAVDVIGRFFGRPISGGYQMSELTQLWIICLAWPLTISISSHVSVRFFTDRLSAAIKRATDILMHLVAMGIFASITWQGLEMVRRSKEQAEVVNILDVPLYPFQIAVPIGAFISSIVLLVQVCVLVAGHNLEKGEK
ncbi:MAG: Tripartite ATP-independent periplasmic transporter [Syntrophorhabdus sp. PtaU1.Bin058]|nr:MAG: Tripartite ATP-independent periplasmic transporter [Syntrophorhabdus sp. PtaU1.Bin058]